MRHLILTTLLLAFSLGQIQSQNPLNVLHYTETSGWDHNTRGNSLAMFQSIGLDLNFTVVDDQTGSEFDNLATLSQYDVVIFSNTSGDNILSATQRSNFEAYMAAGGNLMGIHAASDTYRHSTANGGNTGTWDWYAETIGGSVQSSPNHVSGTPQYSMSLIGTHLSTDNIPNPWVKNEEYYYWLNGYLASDRTPVLEVEETVGPNGQVNDYDAARPMSWTRSSANGSKVFYTALGHANSSYTNDLNFRTHLKDALEWILPSCPADIIVDGVINVNDFLQMNSAFGTTCTGCLEDITGDGVVDVNDFLELNSAFGTSCN